LGEVRFGRDLDRTAVETTVLSVHHVTIPQEILGQEDRRGDVAVIRKPEQISAHGNAALGSGSLHNLVKLWALAPALDGSLADVEERSDLVIGALHPAKLFEFGEFDLRLRPRHSSPPFLEQSQFGTPVRESQA